MSAGYGSTARQAFVGQPQPQYYASSGAASAASPQASSAQPYVAQQYAQAQRYAAVAPQSAPAAPQQYYTATVGTASTAYQPQVNMTQSMATTAATQSSVPAASVLSSAAATPAPAFGPAAASHRAQPYASSQGYTPQPAYAAQPQGAYTAQPQGAYTAQPQGAYTAQPQQYGAYAAQQQPPQQRPYAAARGTAYPYPQQPQQPQYAGQQPPYPQHPGQQPPAGMFGAPPHPYAQYGGQIGPGTYRYSRPASRASSRPVSRAVSPSPYTRNASPDVDFPRAGSSYSRGSVYDRSVAGPGRSGDDIGMLRDRVMELERQIQRHENDMFKTRQEHRDQMMDLERKFRGGSTTAGRGGSDYSYRNSLYADELSALEERSGMRRRPPPGARPPEPPMEMMSSPVSHAPPPSSHRPSSSKPPVASGPKALNIVKGDTISVTVVSARKLQGKENGTADPFVLLSLGRQEGKTSHQKKTTSPEWKETFTFTIQDALEKLRVVVLDYDRFSGNDQLGKVAIPMHQLQPLAWYELEGSGSSKYAGEIKLQVRVVDHRESDRTRDSGMVAGIARERDARQGAGFSRRGSKLTVKVIEAKDLLAKDRGGTSDPYINLKLGDQESKTGKKKKTLDPKWHEAFTFQADDLNRDLVVTCYDYDMLSGDDVIGSVTIPLASLSESEDAWYQLSATNKTGVETPAGTVNLNLTFHD